MTRLHFDSLLTHNIFLQVSGSKRFTMVDPSDRGRRTARPGPAILIGWSIGVNVAFEFARLHPERVAAILAVGGMPGGAFTVRYGPSGLARELREPAGRIGGWLLRLVGPPMAGLASLLPRALGVADRLGLGGRARDVPGLRIHGPSRAASPDEHRCRAGRRGDRRSGTGRGHQRPRSGPKR